MVGSRSQEIFRGYPIPLFYDKEILRLYNNAGVFPAAKETGDHFCKLMLQDIGAIDTLASYAWCERYITEYLLNCSTVNLDGYYAPFLYKKPWTRVLEGKRVLVIHPFAESIKQQYKKRNLLFENSNVLPQFKSLRVIKAVQSIAGNDCGFSDWFSALEYMKRRWRRTSLILLLLDVVHMDFLCLFMLKDWAKSVFISQDGRKCFLAFMENAG